MQILKHEDYFSLRWQEQVERKMQRPGNRTGQIKGSLSPTAKSKWENVVLLYKEGKKVATIPFAKFDTAARIVDRWTKGHALTEYDRFFIKVNGRSACVV